MAGLENVLRAVSLFVWVFFLLFLCVLCRRVYAQATTTETTKRKRETVNEKKCTTGHPTGARMLECSELNAPPRGTLGLASPSVTVSPVTTPTRSPRSRRACGVLYGGEVMNIMYGGG